mgnify:FL=1|jgi:hypothetical protein
MGRVKELLEDHPEDTADFSYEYEMWLKSDEYIQMVNDEVANLAKIYHQLDIMEALEYASNGINIQPEEVGKEVYDKLFSGKVVEFLNKNNEQ